MNNIRIILILLICVALPVFRNAVAGLPTLKSGGTWESPKPSEPEVKQPAAESERTNRITFDTGTEKLIKVDLAVISFKVVDKEKATARIGNLSEGDPVEDVKVLFYVWEENFKGSDWRQISEQHIEKLGSGRDNYTEVSIALSSSEADKRLKVVVNGSVKMYEDFTMNNFKEAGVKKSSIPGSMMLE
ncbi:MAG: hypothetical protein ABIG55_06085 [Candidatus Omnitrophota bacterium]|nr:hypothetical protein [Candidatus Omnitrophota bacterium]